MNEAGGAPHDDSSRELLTDLLARELRAAIFAGSLKPGERIGQARVAEQYGTSRIPVREALQLLQAEGLVTLLPHSGARVARLELDELGEIYEIREHLEPFAISRSVPRLSDEQLAELESYVEQIEEAATDEDIGRWVELDRRFHLTAMSGAPPRLLRIIESLWNGTEHYRRTYLVLPERLQIAQLEHRLLLETMKSRRGEDAANILLVHIRRTRETLVEHGELFELADETTPARKRRRRSAKSE
ncbi:MAG TPA: GntR family transcriptional regulator [Conexibacter sp.]|nr:GntR family transcriptional regulator [Conexibacter sp.]